MASDYVHLHNHTQYSLLDGLTKVPALVDYVKQSGMEAIAITDHGTLSGLIEFYKESKDKSIKPVLGMETYIAARKHTDRDPVKDKPNYHLIVLAMNNQGYKNLMRLSSIANLDGFYYKPRIDHDLLQKYKEGLIVLSGCIGGELGDALSQDQYDKAKQIASWYKSVFGDRYYIEVQDHGHPAHPRSWSEQVKVTNQAFKLAKELGIECVLTCDAHYLKHEDKEAHEILLCVQTASFLSDKGRMSLANFDLHVTKPEELIKRWGEDHPEVITNSRVIADRCKVEITLGNIMIPKFPVPKGETEKSYLEKLVYSGLAWRYGDKSETSASKLTISQAKKTLPTEIRDRAVYELGVIEKMGFSGYFLIIWDFIKWGKDSGIVFGPGRGSAAGSIISYALKITELDALKYGLLFERFLNPDRISMPDIDIDIQDSRRDEVIEYCIDKYGEDRVANIVTFGRMAARNAVRDVARVLQVPYAEADRLAKMIPQPVQGRHIPLEKSIVADQDLKREYRENEQSKQVFDLAIQLEGTIRSHGVHAAGVVIAPDDIVNFVPLEKAQKGVVATQYSMNPIEDLGLLKMDFLGLSNLTTINNALRIIRKVDGQDIDINKIPLDDKKTYELLQRGEATGVFQFESAGMKRYLKELKPTVFEDLVAMGALYRPGPLTAGLTDKFIARKNGLEPVSYDHELMKGALKDTYGVMIYQEHFMQIARDMCGFSGGESDTLRKAVGKKKRDLMAKMKDQVIHGAIAKGVDKAIAEKFWKDLEGFADYAFNKSHAACYGMISYQTAYLKANYPAAFMAALMTSDYDDTDRLAIEIAECKHMNIQVLLPDVNESFQDFGVVPGDQKIRFGLSAIKNVGSAAADEIVRARASQPFADLQDFLRRINSRLANRKTLENLIKAGALDRFDQRETLLASLDIIIAFANRAQKDADSGQTDLFGGNLEGSRAELHLQKPTVIADQQEQLKWERELLGLYLSQHPLEAFDSILSEQTTPINVIKRGHNGKSVSVGGNILESREITTKNGQKMAFIKLGDKLSEIELVLFPSIYQQTIGIWDRDKIIIAKGKVNARAKDGSEQDPKILVDDARELTIEQAAAYQATGKKAPQVKERQKALKVPNIKSTSQEIPKRLYLRIEKGYDHQLLNNIKQTLDQNVGTTEVVLVMGSEQSKQAIKLPGRVTINQVVMTKFGELVGVDRALLS